MRVQDGAVWNTTVVLPVPGMRDHTPARGGIFVETGPRSIPSPVRSQDPLLNPKGIASLSPGLARFRESLPWVTAIHATNPERVEAQSLVRYVQPLNYLPLSRVIMGLAQGRSSLIKANQVIFMRPGPIHLKPNSFPATALLSIDLQ